MHFIKFFKLYTFILLLLPFSVFSKSLDNAAFTQLMKLKLTEAVQNKSALSINGENLFATNGINKIYQLNNYASLWDEESSTQLLTEINDSYTYDGLQKKDYILSEIDLIIKGQQLNDLEVKERVNSELALTESLLRLNYHLRFGKVNPESLDSNWNYDKRLNFKTPFTTLYQAIKDKKINQHLNKERPTHQHYQKLRNILAKYRKLEQGGGWSAIDTGPTIKPGHEGKRVIQLRNRLLKTDDVFANSTNNDLTQPYNESLQQAVTRFQKQHSLDIDGKVGKNTLNALNISTTERTDQIRVNLERLRWIMHELDDKFLLVDIPGFKVLYINKGKIEWQGKIQVGKAYTSTPVFKGKLKYLEFNPTWTIPPGIIKRSILPGLKKDPEYLTKKGFVLLDLKGNKVNSNGINWNSLKGFPYMVRQPAGKDNALGQVKFIFPNSHFVFLHDTNHREYFSRNSRTFSSGCVRVENPFDLAEQLLQTTQGWNRKEIDQLVASGKTKRVHPKDNISVLITYTTVGIDQQKQVFFKPDIYKRDNKVLTALNGKIIIAKDIKKALTKENQSKYQRDRNKSSYSY